MNGQFRFHLPDPPPSRICMDLAEWSNGAGVFGWSGKASRSSRVEWGGFTFWPSPRSDRTELERLGAPWGLTFCIDGDPPPEIPLYPVPGLEVFAWDEGGWLGPLAQNGSHPMVYLRRDGAVFQAAEDMDAFVQLLRDGTDWRAGLVPEPGIQVYASREDAAREWFFLRLEAPPQ